jgi:hypothetical protein
MRYHRPGAAYDKPGYSVTANREQASERAFRKFIQWRSAKILTCNVEAAYGSTVGIPDLQVLFPGQHGMIPVEVKIGVNMIKGKEGRIRVRSLRADQIQWHDKMSRAGGKSCLLIGVEQGRKGWWTGRFDAYVQPRCTHEVLKGWRDGWQIESLTCVTGNEDGLDFDEWQRCLELQAAVARRHILAEDPAALGQPRPATETAADAIKRAARQGA